jgi:UDP-N-acetylglucosamine diphosphorylase / glucose-1-phosphate thymidylyltransferase / UDP-N-acetylgalactosamine diphosphorylase / glucosamine-1-phosphate N-acetyltransferase / galactosamine-1-phosphate N-acetyltransferase
VDSLSDLYDDSIEAELISWIRGFRDPIDLLNNIESLFAGLEKSVILGEVASSVAINGPVHIGAGSVIHPHVTIDGPVIIGENVSIRSHAQIRNHVFLGSNSVVGHGADVKRSFCLNGSKIQDGTFTGDSVLGVAARIGSGAILANRKFNQTEVKYQNDDGEVVSSGREFLGAVIGMYSRIGANVVLSPGTFIGQHTWVGSGAVVHGRYGSDLLITPPEMPLSVRPKERVTLRSGEGDYEHL